MSKFEQLNSILASYDNKKYKDNYRQGKELQDGNNTSRKVVFTICDRKSSQKDFYRHAKLDANTRRVK